MQCGDVTEERCTPVFSSGRSVGRVGGENRLATRSDNSDGTIGEKAKIEDQKDKQNIGSKKAEVQSTKKGQDKNGNEDRRGTEIRIKNERGTLEDYSPQGFRYSGTRQ